MPAQFASTKIQFENPKTEHAAKLMVFSHGEVNLAERECTTGQTLREQEAGDLDDGSLVTRTQRETRTRMNVEPMVPGAVLPCHSIPGGDEIGHTNTASVSVSWSFASLSADGPFGGSCRLTRSLSLCHRSRARDSVDMTVPKGMPTISAISL